MITSVLIDSREADYIQKLTFGGVPCMVMALDAGDLLVQCQDGAALSVERKTANDFLGTLRDDRLFPQLTRLRGQSPWSYLVICGQLSPGPGGKCYADSKETGWTWASVSGALLTVQEIGVNVLMIAGDHEYEAAITRLASRDRSTVRVRPPRDASIVSDAEQILAALPGIGPEKIAALLAYASTPAWAITWLTDDRGECDGKVPGIGLKTKNRIRAALGLEYEDYLGVISKATENEKETK